MPFAEYDDFEDCERANSDKRDPGAYCAAIKRAVEEAKVDEPPEVVHLAETNIPAEGMDRLAEERPGEWGRFESEHGVAWVGLSTGATVYQGAGGESETQQADGFAVDVLEVRQDGDDGPGADGDLLGMGVDFPESDVYVDWNIEAWPDDQQLSDAHVSIYSTVGDLRNATGNTVEVVDTIGAVEAQALFADFNPPGLEQQAVTIDAVALEFPPGGEVIDHEEGDWDAFLDDLAALGDPFQVWKGIQRHPEDDLESHDHATYVALDADRDVTDVADVLADHPAVEYTINAETVGEFDQPDEWDPEGSDFYHGTDSVEQQADDRPGGYAYPEAAPEDAPPEVREAVERFREDPDPDTPLLYRVLGTGTDPYKMAKADADYQGEPNDGEACQSCEYFYTGADGESICAQVAGGVDPEAWCRLYDAVEGVEQEGETVTLRGLSQEGLAFVRERFSVDVVGD